VGVVARSL